MLFVTGCFGIVIETERILFASFWLGGIGFVTALGHAVRVGYYAAIFYAGFELRRLRGYNLARMAAFAAALPCNPAILPGLPTALFTLIILHTKAGRAWFAPPS